ncbi:hypothetical protein ACQJBY_000257 [Aegilops geniculata]
MATTAAAAAAAVPDAIPAAAAAAVVPDALTAAAVPAAAAAAAVLDPIPAAAAYVPDAIPAAAAAVPDAAPVPPSTQPHPGPDKCTNYKSHLQAWTQRNNQNLPAYYTESKRDHHQLEFRSTVKVGGERFQSALNHSRRKDAEQDAARVAYEILVTKTINDDDHTDVLGLIDQSNIDVLFYSIQGVVFCKSILHEFSVKTKADQPTYSTDHLEGVSPMTLFVSSVLFSGKTYTGEAAVSKKDAEQKAAHVAVKSILGNLYFIVQD